MEKSKTSLGLDENVAGLLSYLVGFITGILFFVLEKDNSFVRFHAMQSIITFGGIFVIHLVLGFIPIIGWILVLLLFFVALILWILLMVKAYQGERYKLPLVGDMAEKQI